MNRKLPLFLAVLLLVSLLCTPVAYAAYAPSVNRGAVEDEIEIEEIDVPLVDFPEIRIPVDPDENGFATVPNDELLDAIRRVEEGEAVRITIYSRVGKLLTELNFDEVGVRALIDSIAELKVEATEGWSIFGGSVLGSFDGNVILVIKQEDDVFGNEKGLHVYTVSNYTNIDDPTSDGVIGYIWPRELTLYVPVTGSTYISGASYNVRHYDENGKVMEKQYVGRCVEENDQLWVVISVDANDYLGYYVTLSDAVSSTAVADPSIIVSPLAGKTPEPTIWASVQHWFDSVAGQIMAVFGL